MMNQNKTNEGIDYKDLLRKIPLYNKYGHEYPQGLPPMINLEQVIPPNSKTQPLPPVVDMFQPWLNECDKLIKEAEQYKSQPQKFEEFYEMEYLSKKPPSLLDPRMLSPSKRD